MELPILLALSTLEVVVSLMNKEIGILESFSESWILKELFGQKVVLTVAPISMYLQGDIFGQTELITNMVQATVLDLSTASTKDLRGFIEEVKLSLKLECASQTNQVSIKMVNLVSELRMLSWLTIILSSLIVFISKI